MLKYIILLFIINCQFHTTPIMTTTTKGTQKSLSKQELSNTQQTNLCLRMSRPQLDPKTQNQPQNFVRKI